MEKNQSNVYLRVKNTFVYKYYSTFFFVNIMLKHKGRHRKKTLFFYDLKKKTEHHETKEKTNKKNCMCWSISINRKRV